MNYETIILEKKGNIATITLNLPKQLNASNPKMQKEIADVYVSLDLDREVRVVVVTGAGRAFSAGEDIKATEERIEIWQRKARQGERLEMIQSAVEDALKAVANIRKPVIAAVNGLAVGWGANMTLLSDIVIASEEARFRFPFVARGMAPGFGNLYFLPRLLGIHKACELIFTGRWVDAKEAKEIGLVNEVVPADELAKTTYELASSIAKLPTQAMQVAKKGLYLGMNSSLESQIYYPRLANNYLFGSEDFHESNRAFIEKRKPVFKER